MANAEHYLAMAEEADRLAAIVSYGRDKTRLKLQADSWRERAQMLQAQRPTELPAPETGGGPNGVRHWLRQRR